MNSNNDTSQNNNQSGMAASARVVILGAGESGVGAAKLAQKQGFDVFVSDFGGIAEAYKADLQRMNIPFEENQHTEALILNATEVVKSPGIPSKAPIIKALVEKGGYDESYVYGLVNQVRQRTSVMMPKVEVAEGAGLTQAALRDVIRHERRVEFAFEGLRVFDVIRWEIGSEVYKDLRGFNPSKLTRFASTGIVYEMNTALQRTPFDASKGYLWPIPKTETDANKSINQ